MPPTECVGEHSGAWHGRPPRALQHQEVRQQGANLRWARFAFSMPSMLPWVPAI